MSNVPQTRKALVANVEVCVVCLHAASIKQQGKMANHAKVPSRTSASANRASAAEERLTKEKHQRVADRSVSQGNQHLAPSGLTHARLQQQQLLPQSLCAAMLCCHAQWQRLSQGHAVQWHAAQWQQATDDEITSCLVFGAWESVDLPTGKARIT
jgi:hypothetical protein